MADQNIWVQSLGNFLPKDFDPSGEKAAEYLGEENVHEVTLPQDLIPLAQFVYFSDLALSSRLDGIVDDMPHAHSSFDSLEFVSLSKKLTEALQQLHMHMHAKAHLWDQLRVREVIPLNAKSAGLFKESAYTVAWQSD